MQYGFFSVTLSIKDATTRIELYKFTEHQIKARCESIAIRKAKVIAVDYIHRQWRSWAHDTYCPRYGITAKQLWHMVDDGVIPIPNDKVVDVAEVEMTSWVD